MNTKKPIITTCAKCSQLLILEKHEKHPLCASCNEKVNAKYNQFKNFALIKALRIHKYLKIA